MFTLQTIVTQGPCGGQNYQCKQYNRSPRHRHKCAPNWYGIRMQNVRGVFYQFSSFVSRRWVSDDNLTDSLPLKLSCASRIKPWRIIHTPVANCSLDCFATYNGFEKPKFYYAPWEQSFWWTIIITFHKLNPSIVNLSTSTTAILSIQINTRSNIQYTVEGFLSTRTFFLVTEHAYTNVRARRHIMIDWKMDGRFPPCGSGQRATTCYYKNTKQYNLLL